MLVRIRAHEWLIVCKGIIALLLCLLCLAGMTGCKDKTASHDGPSANSNSSITPPVSAYDACQLINKEEIQDLQSTTVTEAKSSDKIDVFHTSQCYYATAQPNLSVSLVVTQRLGPDRRSPREFWGETFGRYEKEGSENEEDEKKESARERRREKEGEAEVKAKKIDGLGDAAYWTGDRFGGALYVLKKDAYLRISVGGPDSDEGKINKSKVLAEKALSRF